MPRKNVRCFVRTKPTTTFPDEVMTLQGDGKGITMHLKRRESGGTVNNQPEHFAFSFDRVLHEATQQAVYDETAAEVVLGAIEGFNGTVMCYGQTGAGKTFTMTGATESYEHRGLIPRAIAHLFREVRARPETAFVVKVSYIEIYNESMYDLLNPNGDEDLSAFEEGAAQQQQQQQQGLKIVEDSNGTTIVRGARLELVNTEEEALHCLFDGEMNRTIAEHQLNKRSSRSHCVFTLHLDMRSRVESNERIITSKVHFVDLAGSERLAKTGTEGATMKEAVYINKSLSFLEQVIIALADKRREHVPYRQSRLTNLLKDSLGGNCRTTLIANVRCEPQHAEETIATLRFASRMMLVSNNAVVNVQYDPVLLLRKAEHEIKELKAELAMHDQIAGRSHVAYEPFTEEQQAQFRHRIHQYVDGEIEELDFANLRQLKELLVQFRSVTREIQKETAEKLKTASASSQVLAATQQSTVSAPAPPAASTALAMSGAVRSEPKRLVSAGNTLVEKSRASLRAKNPTEEPLCARPPSQQTQLPPLEKGRATTPKRVSSKGGEEDDQQPAPEKQQLAAPGKEAPAGAAQGEKEKEKERAGEGKKEKDGKRAASRRDRKGAAATAATVPAPEAQAHGKRKGKHRGAAPEAEGDEAPAQATAAVEEAGERPSKLDEKGAEQQDLAAGTTEERAAAPEPPKPSDKNEAFEVFKQHRGSELNAALVENKRVLREKKKSMRATAAVVNDLKKEIDTLRAFLEAQRQERRKRPDFDEEQEVIDVKEFEAMKRIKEAKRQYREGFETLKQLQSDAEYLTESIGQSRERLLSEFEEWFGEPLAVAAAVASSDAPAPAASIAAPVDDVDIEEKFDKARQDKAFEMRRQDPEAFAFYNALQQARTKKKAPARP